MYQISTKTKKLLTVAILLVFCAFTNYANAQTSWNISDNSSSGNNVTATLTLADSALTISGTGNMADFLYSATGIPWNSYLTRIKTVIINSGVTNIGDIAFQGCTNLQWITIPEGVKIIGERAFENCTSLRAIYIPASVDSIENQAFRNCTGLKVIANMATTPQNITNSNAFQGLNNLNTIYLAVPTQSIPIYQSANIWRNFTVSSPYFLIEENLGNTIDIAIGNIDGSARYYKYRDDNPNIVAEEVIYSGVGNAPAMAISFNQDGRPAQYVAADGTSFSVYGYNGSTCNGILMTPDGNTYHIENIATDFLQDVYDFPYKFAQKWGEAIIEAAIDKALSGQFPNATIVLGVLQESFRETVRDVVVDNFMPNEVKYFFSALSFATATKSTVSSCVFAGQVTPIMIYNPISLAAAGVLWGVCFYNIHRTWEEGQGMVGNLADMLAGWKRNTNNNACSVTAKLTGGTLLISGDGALCLETLEPYNGNIFSGLPDRRSEITTLIIGGGVTSIPEKAFQGYSNLQRVEIASGTSTLDFGYCYWETSRPFYNSSIGHLKLGRQITYNSGSPFADNILLTSLEISNNVSSIDANCFYNCSGLISVSFGNNLTAIGDNAFNGCINLESDLVISQGVTSIGTSAFRNCTKVPFVFIPTSVMSIGNNAFSGIHNLQRVEIATGADTLNFGYCYWETSRPFYNSSIGHLKLGRQITYNLGSPFADNILLTSLEISNNVSSIDANCFYNCSGLISVSFGNNLTAIGDNAFNGCINLESDLVIPQGVTSIGTSAFRNCTKVPFVFIPASVMSIGNNAFSGIHNLKRVEIAAGTSTLDFGYCYLETSRPFYNSSIGHLKLGRQISYDYDLGSPFADNTLLTSLEINNNVNSINANCFSGCTGLTLIISKATTPPTLSSNTFRNVPTGIPIYVPCGSYINYQSAWSLFTNIIDYCTAVVPAENSAVISWTEIENAVYYEVIVYADEAHKQIIGHYTVDAAGNVTRIRSASEQNELSLTVYGLSASTPYYYTIISYNSEDTEIVTFIGDFTTTSSNNSIENVIANQSSIYPNPAKDEIFIKSELQIMKVEIYSLTGGLMISENNFNGKISVSALPQGVYLLKVHTDKGVSISKIIKE